MTSYRGYIPSPLRGGGWVALPDGALEARGSAIRAAIRQITVAGRPAVDGNRD